MSENYERVEEKLNKDIYEFCLCGGLQKGMIPLISGVQVEYEF